MNFKDQIYDALKYTLKDWKPTILLGTILFIASLLHTIDSEEYTIIFAVFIATIVLLFFEEGYRYKIIKETIKGNNNLPKVGNVKQLFKTGFHEVLILTIYSGITYILVEIMNNMEIVTDFHQAEWVILFIILLVIYFLFFGAAINKALHNDRFISALNLIEIARFYSKIGFKRTIILILLGMISLNFIFSSVMELGIYDFAEYLDFIINFFINPFLILFLTRLTALIGKEVTYD